MANVTYSEHKIESTGTRIVLSVWEPMESVEPTEPKTPEVVIVLCRRALDFYADYDIIGIVNLCEEIKINYVER